MQVNYPNIVLNLEKKDSNGDKIEESTIIEQNLIKIKQ